jgi:3-(3-hydroxy-phenyl)propionate hydroxylase
MIAREETEQLGGYALPTYDFALPPELAGRPARRYRVAVVGGGLTGLTAACDLATRGIEAVVIDEDDTIGVRGAASRGISYAQKSLEIFDRLGIYDRLQAKGITWTVARTLVEDEVIYAADFAAKSVSRQPPFLNIQQFYVEWFLVDRIRALGLTEIRWKSKVTGVRQDSDGVSLTVETPAGAYELTADWVIDASGLHSAVRAGLGINPHLFAGHDRWCISDVRFKKPLPKERWTWVEARANDGRAVWQHLMADNVWRLDFQMTPNADPEAISRIEVVEERLRRHLGPGVEFELVWVGPYAYRTQLLENFRCGRVFFIGDAAHVMSPFGARGGNSGIQDAENLAWKLALVLEGQAPESLLESYNTERRAAAVENIRLTQRTDRFLSPWSAQERRLRKAVIGLARRYDFARAVVNTGRLSRPTLYAGSPVIGHGGQAIQNLPITLPDGRAGHLLDLFREGTRLVAIHHAPPDAGSAHGAALRDAALPVALHHCDDGRPGHDGRPANGRPRAIGDGSGALTQQLDAAAGSLALLRPDMHVAARLERPGPAEIVAAARRALGYDG